MTQDHSAYYFTNVSGPFVGLSVASVKTADLVYASIAVTGGGSPRLVYGTISTGLMLYTGGIP